MNKDYEELFDWLESGEYLPEFMQDSHAQKDLFKTMHYLYKDNENAEDMPYWVQGQCYVIDWFLWYMATCGYILRYTLQKSRKKLSFKPHTTVKTPRISV